ncbi:MAG: thioredoxin [Chitinispirillaceae bacterium]|nr:thioredoxin [Chitinispirillaceae bacterium]
MRLTAFCVLVTWYGIAAQPLRHPPVAQQDSSQQLAQKIIGAKQPVLVDFWAAWCAPCRMLDPILKKLEKEYKGKMTFMKVNVDIHRQIAAYFRVQGIPAVFIIKDRAVQKMITGFQPEETYRDAIQSILAPPAPEKDSSNTPDDTAAPRRGDGDAL